MDITFAEDYRGSVLSPDPEQFVEWLFRFFREDGARMKPGEAFFLVSIPHIGTWKVYRVEPDQMPKDPRRNSIPLRIVGESSDADLQESVFGYLEEAGLTEVLGEKHWRIFSVNKDSGLPVGYIHVALRPAPLMA
jgi:hypothetical protein